HVEVLGVEDVSFAPLGACIERGSGGHDLPGGVRRLGPGLGCGEPPRSVAGLAAAPGGQVRAEATVVPDRYGAVAPRALGAVQDALTRAAAARSRRTAERHRSEQ